MSTQAQATAEQYPQPAKLTSSTQPTPSVPGGGVNDTAAASPATSRQIPKAPHAPVSEPPGPCEWEAVYNNITPAERLQWAKQALGEIHETMVCLRKIAYDRGLRCYHLGKYDKALRYFTWAESYHANAQYFLGRMYESGLGVPRDNHVALIWYRKAASRGHEDALGKLDTPEEESAR